ncbi:MAG: hypothetical protein D3924_15565 [Candidatus Electrothrix sp. AR4]|nr:hypothetical protein [Candidatus Electrothrix sp. AR4]
MHYSCYVILTTVMLPHMMTAAPPRSCDEDHPADFSYLIGGLCINVENRIYSNVLKGVPVEYLDFFSPFDFSKSDLQISMEYASDACLPVPQDIIFSAQYFKIQKVVHGFQVFRYGTDQPEMPYLMIQADSKFSKFQYYFYPYHLSSDKTLATLACMSAADALLLQHCFINHQGLIIHAGGGSIQGRGIVFTGPSGAGKSTLSLLLQSSENRFFSDERLVIRSLDDAWNLWGTPWQGTGNIACNESVPLSAVVFLRQAKETKITHLTPSVGLRRLLQVVSIPWYSEEWTNKGLTICESLIQEVPMVELAFRPDQTAVQAVEEFAAGL